MKKPRKRHTPPQDDNGLSSGTTNRPREASPKEVEYKTSLLNLERQITWYQGRAREGRASQQDAERVAAAMEHVATSHPDPEGNDNDWREKAEKFRMADPKDRDNILGGILDGLLTLLTVPFQAVGAVLQVAGGILSGVGFALRGLGGLARTVNYTGNASTSETAKSKTNTQ
ncbi:hypothetical protein AGABI1DRAFT_83559 [Agaricus bisporus var. burnettii JB137-S8]|uniref:Uncharacterized protein n=1 Tax=Agaricus bisporus var. burnettii (strain JB137-S8 / ATCC MYA-4627 / FGSC 10392) TaxID=597362 RepID=K5W1B8_AGABU|nr:uncharacterized protein AGABI1DRAFT_83559 [Agaricus bisporus var. burnettii JB137-S8]EKM80564.1 hypothetical protein AGABI1DRAFT_83559 [Agaricus bisporus var. burnettii JB137-S8]